MPIRSFPFLALVLLAGCAAVEGSSDSLADSSAGAFESLISPFESVSTSSGSGGGHEARVVYTRDVMAFTATYLHDPAQQGDFARGLSQVAAAHGVNDWEADPDTFAAIEAAAAAEDPSIDEAARARLRDELETLGRED